MNEIYFDTFRAALDGAKSNADSMRVLLHHPADIDALADEPLNYEQNRAGHFEIETYRGRPTRKYFHVVLYRMSSGRYELTTYVA